MSLKDIYEQKRDSKCPEDAHKHHFWEKLGVAQFQGDLYLTWRCTQCKKIILEPLESLTLALGNEEVSRK